MKRIFLLILSGLICFFCIFDLSIGEIFCLETRNENPPQFVWKVPQAEYYFASPTGIAIDGSGNMYVVDSFYHRIQKFSSDGTFVNTWGSYGCEDGQFIRPTGIAVDSSGNVYVVDSGKHCIQKFSSDGTFVNTWGSKGSGDGQFNSPEGIAIDSSDNVYVADTGNHRIQKFRADGTLVNAWGSEGSGDGQFDWPRGIAVDSSGNVYIADTQNWRIKKFSSDGTLVNKWVTTLPSWVAVDSSGNVYVADSYKECIQKFSSDGTLVNTWGSYGSEDGQFDNPQGLAVDGSGNVYVVDSANNRIQKFSSDGTLVNTWGSYGSGDDQFIYPSGIAVDGSGNVYVADSGNDRIRKFRSDGTLVNTWGSEGSGDGQFVRPSGIAIDSSGNVYVVDSVNNRIQKFSSDGTFINTWGSEGSEDGQFNWPEGIAIDSSGNVYVADEDNNRIQKFNSDGTFVNTWGSYGWEDDQFRLPNWIAVDSSDNVYVTDYWNHRIKKFSSNGTLVNTWGSCGSGDGQFNNPRGIAIDGSGNVYVVDSVNNRIQKFTYSGIADFTLSALNGNTTEQGNQATFTINLDTRPSANVIIALSSSNTQEGMVSPASLTFTPANWDTPQTVTITGVDDDIDDGDQTYSIITAHASSSDEGYNGLNPKDVWVTNNDDDTADISISPLIGLFTRENPTDNRATFTVVLGTEPTAEVTIDVSSSNTQEGTVSPAHLTFTPADWDTPQTVTITGVDDDIDDGDIGYTITITALSSDITYNSLSPFPVEVTNSDNDSANVTINPTAGLSTSEEGAQDTFTVVLNTHPTDDVTIALSSSNTQEGTVSPASLTFTPADWDTPQIVTITGVDDDIDDGDTPYTIITGYASSSDESYNGLNPQDISVTNNGDDDTAGISVTPLTGLITSEEGTQDTFTVVLGSEPTAEVTINISTDTTEGSVFTESLIFSSTDWDIPQTVTVTGMDDDEDDCNQEYTIALSVDSFDLTYSGLTSLNVTVTNLDDDVSSDAGEDQTVDEGHTITLNGANSSSCADVTYRWEQIFGPSITLADPNSAVTTFVPPPVDPNESISFTFRLTVRNSIGVSALDDVVITVNDNSIHDFPPDVIAMRCAVSGAPLGIKTDGGNIIRLNSQDPAAIDSTAGSPQNLMYGLIDMSIKVNQGDTVIVTIYLPEPAPEGYIWHQYSAQTGWQDYSNNAVFNNDRMQITLTLTDGGAGDSDGLADGVIVDPSGLGTPPVIPAGNNAAPYGGGGGGGDCFITCVTQ